MISHVSSPFFSRASDVWRLGSTNEELAFRRVKNMKRGLACQGDFTTVTRLLKRIKKNRFPARNKIEKALDRQETSL
jgi:hypothetical protein